MSRNLLILLGLGAVPAGCDLPIEVQDLAPFEPPPAYQAWWSELEECARLEGDFGEIEWYTGEAVEVEGRDAFGVWLEPNQIIIERFYATSEPAVKHEMLHQLSGGTMPHGHSAFKRCTCVESADSLSSIVDALTG